MLALQNRTRIEPAGQGVTAGDHQWPADLDAEDAVWIPLRQTQQAAASGAADVEMDRLKRLNR